MDLIPKIVTSTDPITIVQQFLQTFSESSNKDFNSILVRLFLTLRSKNVQHRANVAFTLSQFVRRFKNSLDPKSVYELSKETLLKDSSTVENRRSMIALMIAWNAMVRGGLFTKSPELIISILRMLFGYSNERECYLTIGYQTIWSVIDCSFKTMKEFNKVFTEIVNELGEVGTPPHADSYCLWIYVNKKFPELPLKSWAKSPVSSATLRALSSVLENTIKRLPEIHVIWHALASVDPNQLVFNIMEIYGKETNKNKYIPMVATISAFERLEVHQFIKILETYSNYYLEISTSKYGKLFNEAIIETSKRLIKAHSHRAVQIINALIRCLRNKKVEKLAAQLNDNETKELFEAMQAYGTFETYMELLWAQTKRENIDDTTILGDIFKKTLSLYDKNSEKSKAILIPFLSHIADAVLSYGSHWYSVISPQIKVPNLINRTEANIVKHSIALLEGSKEVHKVVGFEEHKIPIITTIDSVIEAALELLNTDCEICKSIGRALAINSLYVKPSAIEQFDKEPLILYKALAIKSVSLLAIPLFLKNLKQAPRNILSGRVGNINVQFEDKEAAEILKSIINVVKGNVNTNKKIYSAIAERVIEKMEEKECEEIINDIMKEEIEEQKIAVDFLPLFYHRPIETANYVLELLLKYLNQEKSNITKRKIFGWLDDLIVRFKFNAEQISRIITISTDFEFGDKMSERKKAEEIVNWCVKLIAMNKDIDVNLDGFKENLKKFENSKSKPLRQFMRVFLLTEDPKPENK